VQHIVAAIANETSLSSTSLSSSARSARMRMARDHRQRALAGALGDPRWTNGGLEAPAG
jgi:hypothetical protein